MSTVLFGTVKDNVDPEGLGRIQVSLSDHGEEVVLPWLRLVQPIASKDFGVVWLPDIEDQVVILAGGGGPESMVVLGSLYSGTRKPPGEAKVEHKHFLTKSGNELFIDDTEGSETIRIATKDSKLEVVLDQAGPQITITAGDTLTVTSDAKIEFKTKDANVEASGNVTIKGKSAVKVEGGNVEIKGSGSVKVSGSMVELG